MRSKVVFAAACLSACLVSAQKLVNGGFEEAADGKLKGWRAYGSYAYDTATVYAGTGAIRCEVLEAGKGSGVMQEIVDILKTTYHAEAVAIVPGGGSYAMEAVARQFATDQRCLVIRNGFFSYRWSQIFEMGRIPAEVTVCQARPNSADVAAAWSPAPVEEVVETIRREKPAVVFAAHVETASGILLPDDYVRAVAAATREVGGLFVLDCIASGALWVDMADLGVDGLWLSPFYRSPLADAGYDVADYRDVDPRFGTLADVDTLIARAHELGLAVVTWYAVVGNEASRRVAEKAGYTIEGTLRRGAKHRGVLVDTWVGSILAEDLPR